MERLETNIVIVGSGAGGASLAKELVGRGKKILIVEKGITFTPDKIGTELRAYNFYDKHGLWCKTKEGVFYYRAFMTGGTTVVSCGNAVVSLKKELKKIGIDLTGEFSAAERELGVRPIPRNCIGKGSKKIMEAANALGIKMRPMPKLINFEKCVSCGNCVLGCVPEGKWTALDYIKEAQDKGASLLTGITVTKVITCNGRAIGVEGRNHSGQELEIFADTVVLAAGGLGTPVILQNSGIAAGKKLFLDLFTVTMGLSKDSGLTKEPVMAGVSRHKGFILSPFIDSPLVMASVLPLGMRGNLKINQRDNLLGIMVKIDDDRKGQVNKDGLIEKTVTRSDLSKLNKGQNISKKILIKAGVVPWTIVTTKIRGAHPGGTAAIGEVVNNNLETRIKGLFVCDSSVLPVSPGLPPIVTIVALAKRLAKQLRKK
ncbi:MAG: GMC family oxidoreductase N-terminal domain-containing protein [Deltaproteobacteria bacterium]